MKVYCPKCSQPAIPINYTRGASTAVGIVSGGGCIIAGMVNGARAGSCLGATGIAVGSVVGATMAVLFGASSGGITGSQVGRMIDENIIGRWRCTKCGHRFKV